MPVDRRPALQHLQKTLNPRPPLLRNLPNPSLDLDLEIDSDPALELLQQAQHLAVTFQKNHQPGLAVHPGKFSIERAITY